MQFDHLKWNILIAGKMLLVPSDGVPNKVTALAMRSEQGAFFRHGVRSFGSNVSTLLYL